MAYIKKKYGKRNPANAAMFMKLIDRKFNDKLVWTLNVDAVLNGNISGFDTKLRYDKPTAYFLRGAKSFDFFRSIVYRKVFPNMDKKNIIQIADAGHFLQYEKPDEIAVEVVKFLEDINSKTEGQT